MTETAPSNVIQMPKPKVFHAYCDGCFPMFQPYPQKMTTWCGEEIDKDEIPDHDEPVALDANGIPHNACTKCVESKNCAVCGLSEDAYEEGP